MLTLPSDRWLCGGAGEHEPVRRTRVTRAVPPAPDVVPGM
jgi:hypothetical protein